MKSKKNFWDIMMCVPEEISKDDYEHVVETYNFLGKEAVYNQAKKNKILPFVAHTLVSLKIDLDYWNSTHEKYLGRSERIIAMLEIVFNAFKDAGCVTPCVTENFGALLTIDNCLACFSSGDVDISADINEANDIQRVLKQLGFTWLIRKDYHTKLDQEEYKCPEVLLKDFYINIVWLPVLREKSYTINQEKVNSWLKKERLRGVYYRSTSIRLLTKESMLIHCMYHLSVGHYYCASPGVKLLTELDRLIRYCNLDWDLIINVVKTLKIDKRMYIALCLTKIVLGTPIPQIALSKYGTSTILNRLVKQMYPLINGEYVVQEPIGLLKRLCVDTISDDGNIFSAFFNKIIYASKIICSRVV